MDINEVSIFYPESREIKTVKFDEMTLDELRSYRASVEVYGTASELYEVEMRIKKLGGNH